MNLTSAAFPESDFIFLLNFETFPSENGHPSRREKFVVMPLTPKVTEDVFTVARSRAIC